MKAIDLYSGVGGWSLGLRMAGVEVVSSYEWWHHANLTNSINNSHPVEETDIRLADASSFPGVDIVVGSPPCTHFSLANRGGRGNIGEGLKDVEKFLEIVDRVKPRFWAMENVPRLAEILKAEMNQGGRLHRFVHLDPLVAVVDASEWGVPQRRKRALIGRFDLDLMLSYRAAVQSRTLGGVIDALAADTDPVYALSGPFTDHVKESPLSWEEERLNRDAKTHHPVYNGMAFPDDPSRPSRTVTATCTRVSRESVVVEDSGAYRRLTLRERASLQSFPASYQFYAPTHALKQKMIGNALPPLLAYHLAHSMLGTPAHLVPTPAEAISAWSPPSLPPPSTKPDSPGRSYPVDRKFRAAIPGLRFKSGMRFELSNSFVGGRPRWGLKFFFGNSKAVTEIPLGQEFVDWAKRRPNVRMCIARATNSIVEAGGILDSLDARRMQRVWCHREEDYANPYQLVDAVGKACSIFLGADDGSAAMPVVSALLESRGNPAGSQKVLRNAAKVFAGLLVCSIVNDMMDDVPSACEAEA